MIGGLRAANSRRRALIIFQCVSVLWGLPVVVPRERHLANFIEINVPSSQFLCFERRIIREALVPLTNK